MTGSPAGRAADLHVAECGDSGLLVTFTGPGDQPWQMARQVATSLLRQRPPGLIDVVASYASTFLAFDLVPAESALQPTAGPSLAAI